MIGSIWYACQEPRQKQDLVQLRDSERPKLLAIAKGIASKEEKMSNVRHYSAPAMRHAQRAWVMWGAVDVMIRPIWYACQELRQQQDLVQLRNSKLLKMLTIARGIAKVKEKMRNVTRHSEPVRRKV
eukprot:GHVO01012780.1.p2 GENE.GHVO01012780.1~~GHVO01012780.1.p2  ORF type:complete len:127 (+),score=14.70 GHVO01012780.1:165-545(+)